VPWDIDLLKLLLTHTPDMRTNYYGERALSDLRSLADVQLHEGRDPLQPLELIDAARTVDVVIADRLTAGPAEIFAASTNLKAFLRCAVDIRNIDVAAATAAGVLVTRAKPGFVESVTELTLGLLVDLARGVSRATADYHAGHFPEVRMGRQLAGSTIGIIGYGAIARHLAPVAAAIGMTVLVADPHVRVDDARFRQVPLEILLAEADHVVCLAVATEATENLMDAAAFRRMKRDAVFINVSRGNLVDDAALAAALREGTIAAAAMDVGRALDQMPTPAIVAMANVVATPHIGGLTPPAIEAQALDTVEQVRELVAGQVPHGAVNAEHWSRHW
jgi:D-3-phosphoglycerate dehydrogenase / 2-oxoglutarate reductase